MKKKEKSTGAVFIMVIETSQLYFIYLFIFLPKLSIYFTKTVFKGTAMINREKHMLKTRNQDNTEIKNDFSIEF